MCLPACSPTPTIKWYRKGGDLPERKVKFENFNKTLLVVGVSEEDAGEYVCMANNHLGSVRHSILVQVKGQDESPAKGRYEWCVCCWANRTSCVAQRLPIGWTDPPTWCWRRMRTAAWCVGPTGIPNLISSG